MKRFCVLLSLLWLPMALLAQTGKLCGTITDQSSKEPLLGVSVKISTDKKVLKAQTQTDEKGVYCIDSLPAGKYRVEFRIVGYMDRNVLNVESVAGKTRRLDAKLNRKHHEISHAEVSEELGKRSGVADRATSKSGVDAAHPSEVRLTAHEIKKLPSRDVKTITTTTTTYSLSSAEVRPSPSAESPVIEAYEMAAPSRAKRAEMRARSREMSRFTVKSKKGRKRREEAEVAAEDVTETPTKKLSEEDLKRKEDAAEKGASQPAGILTAGEIHDYAKWGLWTDLTDNEFGQYSQQWALRPRTRYTVQVMDERGFPVVDARLDLLDKDGKTLWTTHSDNTGKGELWVNLVGANGQAQAGRIQVSAQGQSRLLEKIVSFPEGTNTVILSVPCHRQDALDVAFVVDATGSMGDEIRYLKAELSNVIGRVRDSLPRSDIHLGSVFYRDKGDEYLTRESDLTGDISKTVTFIRRQWADGGGDFPEAVEAGLEKAIRGFSWRPEAKARLLFLVLDAPPHQNPEVVKAIQSLTQEAAAKGIRIIPITASGIDKATEFLMRSMALATNGTYVFLTDHSGVGDKHLAPSTDTYEVKHLNNLLVEIIARYATVPDCQAPGTARARPDTVVQRDTLEPPALVSTDTGQARIAPVENNPTAFTWRYWPNPATAFLNIHLDKAVDELFLTDINGKLLQRITPPGPEFTLDVHLHPIGTYYVRFHDGNRWQTGRFLVTR